APRRPDRTAESAYEIQSTWVDLWECCSEAGSIPVVTHGRATRAMSASEELVNASSFRKCRAMVSSGMLQERLLRHTLDFTRVGQVMFSTDYPFHQPSRAAVGQF